jgi:hypothetical protein
MAEHGGADELTWSTSYWIRGIGGDGAHQRRWVTVSNIAVGKKSTAGQTSGCRRGSSGRRGTTGVGEALDKVIQFGGGQTVAGDVEQLTAEEAAGEGLASASVAVGLGSKRLLHEEGTTADQFLLSNSGWGG